MLWLKAFHLVSMVTWFAGLFYLPRLFVYHAMTEDTPGLDRFKLMERRLLLITHIGMGLTWVFGIGMLLTYAWELYGNQGWLHTKLTFLVLMTVYTIWCGRLVRAFRADQNRHSQRWYRWFNEVPVVFLLVITLLAVLKPF